MQFETGDWTAFGATPLADGRVRFRLWAPGLRQVSVVLEDTGADLPLANDGDGWFALTTDAARIGTRYRYRMPDGLLVPDPASRCQADDAHGPSVVADPAAYPWRETDWRGRPWHETALVELHVGTVTPQGSFAGLHACLDHYVAMGLTAIEMMPVADFPGRHGWGYDGVLQFAPDRAYGSPEDLQALIDAAHARGLMVFLDVVYNHFGPDGNYLHVYAPQFFTERHHTPWGSAIDFGRRPVRDFYIANTLYWLEAFRFDGLRFDAVHAIRDDSPVHILTELAEVVHRRLPPDRHVHLVLENDANEARFLRAGPGGGYTAQWNDDYHHVLHVLQTGERDGYYEDYGAPLDQLAKALTTGYVYQGDPSQHRGGEIRGEPSGHLPPTAFVNFIQNHDQIGNRAFGDRLTRLASPAAVDAALALLLVAPQVPMLYMGEEWGATEPFLYFCDFHDELADAVREGRRREFGKFAQFTDPAARETIPDPNDAATVEASRLRWPDGASGAPPDARRRMDLVARLLRLRARHVAPMLPGLAAGAATARRFGDTGLEVTWTADGGTRLVLVCNLSDQVAGDAPAMDGAPLVAVPDAAAVAGADLPPWSVIWSVAGPGGAV